MVKSFISLLFLFTIVSCKPEIVFSLASKQLAKPLSYNLQVTDKSKILYIYDVSGIKHSVFGENGQIVLDANVPASWDIPLSIESYTFVNASEKTDRYYYLDSSSSLYSTFDGVAVTQLTNFPVRNGPFKNLVTTNGLFFTRALALSGGNTFGDGYYFSTKRNVVEKIIDRLGLVDGSMPIYAAQVAENYTETYCTQNPGSCTLTPYTWSTKVIMLENKNSALGIASRIVEISGSNYLIPYYVFRINDSSVTLEPITGLSNDDLADVAQTLLLSVNYRVFKDDSRLSFITQRGSSVTFFGIRLNDLSLEKFGNFSGTLTHSLLSSYYHEEDLASEILYPSIRLEQGGVPRFYFYVNGEWKNAPSLDANIPPNQVVITVKHDSQGGWNFKMGNSLFRCEENLSNCQNFYVGVGADSLIFEDSIVLQGDTLSLYKKGVIAKTYSFTDYSSGGNIGSQFLFYREGSIVILRIDNSPLSNGNVYLFSKDLLLKESLVALEVNKYGGMPSNDTQEEETFWLAYLKILLGVNGSYYTIP